MAVGLLDYHAQVRAHRGGLEVADQRAHVRRLPVGALHAVGQIRQELVEICRALPPVYGVNDALHGVAGVARLVCEAIVADALMSSIGPSQAA